MCHQCHQQPPRHAGGTLCYGCYRQVRAACAGCAVTVHPSGLIEGHCRDCAERIDRRRRALIGCGVGPRHARIRTFAELAESCRHDGYRRALGKVKEFLAADAPSILALIGPRGTGKTTLASVAVIEAIQADRKAHFFDARDAVAALKAAFVPAGKGYVSQLAYASEDDWLGKLCRLHLLALDEIDLAMANEYSAGQLRLLLDRRYRMALPTIVCSAASVNAFRAAIGPDIQRRLADGGGVLACEGWPPFKTTAPANPLPATEGGKVVTPADLARWNPHNGGLDE